MNAQNWKIKHEVSKDFYLFCLDDLFKIYNEVIRTYIGWLSTCKGSIESSNVLGVICKNGAWQGIM